MEIIRIADLLAIDALGTRLLAGSTGTQRRVLWAHSCELEFPDRWLGEDELLMTVGLGVPAGAEAQVDLIRRLDRAGLAGIAVGDDAVGPPLTDAMLAEADSRGFPVLMTTHSVPFAAIGRTVAAANSHHQAQQVLTLNRLYHALLEVGDSSNRFLTALEEIFNVTMRVVDIATGVTLLPGALHVTNEEIDHLIGPEPASSTDHVTRVEAIPRRGVSAWRVPSQRATVLLIDESEAVMLDSFTVVHLGRAVSIEADRRASALLARSDKLAQVLGSVFSGEGNVERLRVDAEGLGLPAGDLVVLVGHDASGSDLVADALSLAGIPHGAMTRNGYLTVLLSADDLPQAREIAARAGLRTGASRRVAGLDEVAEAALNAQWALESISREDAVTVDYDDATFSVMPRTPGEANELVRRVLGALMEDGASTMLLDTLCAFLDEDRNWTATAERLGIHRQTLAYRLKQIEKITGRRLKRTRDLAELWIARTALRLP